MGIEYRDAFGGPTMGTTTRNDARVDFRLPSEVKSLIEEAAALAGQSLRACESLDVCTLYAALLMDVSPSGPAVSDVR